MMFSFTILQVKWFLNVLVSPFPGHSVAHH